MPELPEVHTTVTGLQRVLPELKILGVWTDYNSPFNIGKNNIKNPKFFKIFSKAVINQKVKSVTRRGKNILINLQNGKTILVHMKMTGHLMYGKYSYDKRKNKWTPNEDGPLKDPYNRFVHLVATLSNKKQLVLSDARKFAKITILDTKNLHESDDLKSLGFEPFSKDFTFQIFKETLSKRPKTKIKQVLMDQSLISGIGNIYSDEILWEAGVHPESLPKNIPDNVLKKMFSSTLLLLSRGIDFGGDSTSDYRNIYGEPGKFHHKHQAYRRKNEKCRKLRCKGIILRKIIGGRSSHFCSVHQKLY